MKRVFLWIWIVLSGVVGLAALVATIVALVRREWVGAILPGIIAVGFGVSCIESARRRRFKFFFFET